MPPPRKIDLLPPELRGALDAKIVERGFAGYVDLSEWLASQGYEIGKSALHAHGQDMKLQRRMDAVKAATAAALAMDEAVRDDAGALSNALLTQMQVGSLDALNALLDAQDESDPAERLALLSQCGRNLASLVRAVIARQQHAAAVKAKITTALDALGKSGAVPMDTLARVQQAVQAAYGNL
jgi:hypothetical protein